MTRKAICGHYWRWQSFPAGSRPVMAGSARITPAAESDRQATVAAWHEPGDISRSITRPARA
jgi:hypothetical protein